MSIKTLLLTPWYSPHKVIHWQDAVTMLFLGKVEVVQEYDDEPLRSPSVEMKMPAVVRLTRNLLGTKRVIKFSRMNVLARDGFCCQYCGERKSAKELNYDHVVPRCQGGKTVWENITTACYPCNLKKGRNTPEQAGMKLLVKPYRPKALPLSPSILSLNSVHPIWKSWVG